MLTRDACKRYLEQSTLQGAPRQLREWFSSPGSDDPQAAMAAVKGSDRMQRSEVPDDTVTVLANWVFEQHGHRLKFKELEQHAIDEADNIGSFKVSEFHEAYQRVYATQKHAPPKTGWPLREPYRSEWKKKQKSQKSLFSRGTLIS